MAEQNNILLNLPPEIVEMTAEYLDAPSQLGLRPVNKEVAARTERPMLKANFTDLHIRFCSRSSLINAMRIAQHDKFKRWVRSVTMFEGRFDLAALHETSFPGSVNYECASRQGIASHRRIRAQLFELAEDSEEMERTGFAEDRLRELFTLLAPHSGRLMLTVTDLLSYDWNRLLQDDILKVCKSENPRLAFLKGGRHSQLALVNALVALMKTNTRLASFTAGARLCKVPLDLFALGESPRDMQHNFDSLSSLILVLDGDPSQSCEDHVGKFVDFLHHLAPHLNRFELSHYRPHPGMRGQGVGLMSLIVDKMFQSLTLPVLQRLSLDSFNCSYDLLVAFLARHGSHLQDYTLSNGRVTDPFPGLKVDQQQERLHTDLRKAGFPIERGILEIDIIPTRR